MYSTIGGGFDNTVASNYAFIGGGQGNTVWFDNGSIVGGDSNWVDSEYSTILGGAHNEIELNAEGSVILGGNYSTARGPNTLIFGDLVGVSGGDVVAFFAENALGSLAINRTDPYSIDYPIHVGTSDFGSGGGAYLSGSGVWTNASLRIGGSPLSLDNQELVQKISTISVNEWENSESGEKHIGPAAEDFVEAFDVGTIRKSDGKRDNQYLAASDVAGVALAGVQELIKTIEELRRQNADLERRIRQLEQK
jgi:hypothetical protein